MSKRGASGPQGESGINLLEFNMASTPEEKPQRATAAQMANRKIKDVRRRRPNAAAPGATGTSFTPFSSIDPNTVSSTSAEPQPTANGFAFGQSQSFPGASSNPPQPSENGGSPFAFGSGGGGSSSFNFSSSFGGSAAAPSNPFAHMNTGGSNQPSGSSGFSGFKGSAFNLAPSGSQPPAQQPLPSGGLFGSGSQQNNASTGGMFSSTTTTAPSTRSSTTPTTAGIFGQTSTSSTAPPIIFGQSTSDKPSLFGQSSAFGSDSMQTSPDPKANAAASKPSIFGTESIPQPSFKASTNFGTPGAGSLFGGPTAVAGKTPSKPLFGTKPAEQSTPTSTSLFGATTQTTTTAPPPAQTPASTATAAGTASTLFGATPPAKPATPFQNSFQSTNLFSATPKASEEKDEKKPSEAPFSKSGFQFTPSTGAGGASLFAKSESAATTTPAAPSSGLFQPPSTGNLFAPKPTALADTNKPNAAEGNPFGNLFTPKSATATQPTQEQKAQPAPTPFGGLFAPKPSTPSEVAKTSEPEKSTTPTPIFSASAPKPSNAFAQPSPLFSASATANKTQAPVFTPTAPQSPFKVNGVEPTAPAPSTTSAAAVSTQSFEKLQPRGLPADLSQDVKDDVELLYRIRMLNECFKREIASLDPATDDFDLVVQFYMRVRETIGAPTGFRKSKRKTRDDESTTNEAQSVKKVKPFGTSEGVAASKDISSPASGMNIAPSSITSTTSKLFGTNQTTPTIKKDETPVSRVEGGDSTTANIFAQSFSKSRSTESGNEPAGAARPSTPESNKPTLFSTTPTTSPAKPLFPTPATTKETSTSLFSASVSKPVLTAPTSSASVPASNPFVLKPTGDKASNPATGAAPAIPKFGNGTVPNFFAQFKSQADKDAEKEKEKRKAEDFDSEEEDEAEWEQKYAEEQRKKREDLEAQSKKRAKFVPGKGFVFEDEANEAPEPKETASAASPSVGTSVFDMKSSSPAKPNNIFGHLSATPSEVEEDEDDGNDTEEASAAGEEPDVASKDSLFVPTSEDESTRDAEISESESKAVGSGAEFSANESSDDGDLTKALKKSKQAANGPSTGGRSLFDRVEYDQEGKPKREAGGEQKNPFGSLFNPASKPSPSLGTPGSSTPNPFAPVSKSASGQGDASAPNTASTNNFGGLFSSPAPASSGSNTGSIFGQASTKPAGDNTWKVNSPITFGSVSAPASTTPKPDSGSATPAPDSSKPFSLFGAQADGANASGGGQQSLGFSFGAPSQQSSSFLAPSVLSSATPSRASTPGIASDTGADESGDGDAEALPQVNLAQSRAGEENEDIVLEIRARAMKLKPGAGWDSQGVGFLRILKDRTTSKARVILRADPSGKVVLNAALMKQIKYTVNGNSVMFLVPQAEGAPEQWAIRVKKEEVERLGSAMEESKA